MSPMAQREGEGTAEVELVLLFVVVSWAATHSMVKAMFAVMTPFGMTALRFLLMMAGAGIVLAFSKPTFERQDWPRLFLVSMLSHGAYQFAYVLSIYNGGAFLSGVLLAMLPVFTIVVGSIARIEIPTRMQVVGIMLATSCAIGFTLSAGGERSGTVMGTGLILCATLLFACYGIAVKPLTAKYSTWSLISAQVLIGGIPLVLAGFPELLRQDWSRVDAQHWTLLVILSYIPAFAGYAGWNWAISKVGAARTSAYALLVPILASVISLVTLREPWTVPSLVFAAGLIGALAITRSG
jgi:drug/metabolite transporter (DMT)-like permease